MSNALLIIDVQQILCTGDYEVFDSAQVIERINQISRRARKAQVPVIIIQHETRGGGPMDYASDGWKLSPDLIAVPTDIYIRKQATDSFHNTELQVTLEQLGVTHLTICGLQSEFCVDTTTRRALALGYPVTLVSDGHSTMDNGVLSAKQITDHHNITLANIESFGVRVVTIPTSAVHF